MFNMSAAMAEDFVTATTTMTEQITILGPNPLRAPRMTSTDAERGD
jgi:coenzyme F420-reducing hydrogenase delta subunit